MRRLRRRWPLGRALCAVVLLGGCTTAPRAPDWQLDARDSLERANSAYLAGDGRVAAAEYTRARAEVAATGRSDLVARVELTRCAAEVASLAFGPCSGFEPLRADAGAEARAYADHLAAARVAAVDVARLPPAQRAVAVAIGAPAGAPAPAIDVGAIADPLSRLVAAGVLFRAGLADGGVIATAIATASAEGWRRPLLAWLEVDARRAEAAGAADEAARLRRRIELVQPRGGPAGSVPVAPAR